MPFSLIIVQHFKKTGKTPLIAYDKKSWKQIYFFARVSTMRISMNLFAKFVLYPLKAHLPQKYTPSFFLLRYKLYIYQALLFVIKKIKLNSVKKQSAITFLTVILSSFTYTEQTPKPQIDKFLRSLETKKTDTGLKTIEKIYIINLDKRPERWIRSLNFFQEYNLTPERVQAVNGWEIPNWTKLQLGGPSHLFLSGGEIGCFLSHLSIYQDALEKNLKTVWICEDDITFINDPHLLDDYIEELEKLDPSWDMLYTDHSTHGMGDQKTRPYQENYTALHYPVSDNLLRIHGRHGLHSVIFSKSGLLKIMKYFRSNYLFSPLDVDIHYVPDLREYSVITPIATALNTTSDTSVGSSLNKKR